MKDETTEPSTVPENGAGSAKRRKTAGPDPNRLKGFTDAVIVVDPNAASSTTTTVEIVSTGPLIHQVMSEKSQRQMLEKQMGKAKGKRAPKDPTEDFLNSLHYFRCTRPDTPEGLKGCRFGLPAAAFKKAIVAAAGDSDFFKTQMMRALFVEADDAADCSSSPGLVLLKTDKPPVMRQDWGRNANRNPDIRFRGMFESWSATLRIRHNWRLVTAEQLIALVQQAGEWGGMGEWRLSRGGIFGGFRVISARTRKPIFA